MKNRFTLLSAAVLLSLSSAQAQTSGPARNAAPDGPHVHIDIVHDQPENDPSDPRTVIRAKTFRPQQDFAWQETLRQLAVSSLEGMVTWTNPVTMAQELADLFTPAPPTYEELLKNNPRIFNFFFKHQHRYKPQLKYGPTTVNANHEYIGISDRKFGYCWGYATFVRFFTQVAFYDPSLPKPPLSKTLAAVDQILKGEAAVIEGYANMRELTLNPQVEFYLKIAAMELWRARAMQFTSVGVTLNSTKWMNFDEVENFLVDLETRLKRGEFPKLVFASLIPTNPFMGMNTDIHVVPAYRVERLPNNRARIHLWDINFYTETLEREPKFIEIDSNHGFTYSPYVETDKPYARGSDMLGRVIIAPENDAETATMANSLLKFCMDAKTKKYCQKYSD